MRSSHTFRPSRTVALATGLSLLSLAACGDSTGSTGPAAGSGARMSFAVTTGLTGAPIDGVAGRTDGTAQSEVVPRGLLVTSGDDELLLTRVQLVLREVELERYDDDCDDDDDDRPRGRRGDCDDEVELGPFLVELPLAEGTVPAMTITAPEGLYEEVEFVMHTPDNDDQADRDFVAANPEFRRISAIVEGVYNGRPFTYVTRARIKHEIEFEPPLAVGLEGEDITIDVNVGAWFAKRGGGLLSPLEGSMPGLTRAMIDNNIRHTFRAFRDRNKDGRRDR